MSDQERIEAAVRKKEEGNILFKNWKYQRARKKYDKVFWLTIFLQEHSA